MSIRFECFGMTILKALAIDLKDPRDGLDWTAGGVLTLTLPNEGKISLFMPYSTALEYASAINACNDREVVSAIENLNANP